jgi:hypothetical protein
MLTTTRFLQRYLIFLMLLVAVMISGTNPVHAAPRHVYLVWDEEQTADNITVVFHTLSPAERPRVRISPSSSPPTWREIPADSVSYNQVHPARHVHRSRVTGLTAGQTYLICAGDDAGGFSDTARYTHLPETDQALRFVVGGDMGTDRRAQELARIALRQDPAFVVIGGDLAYANGKWERLQRWDQWFDLWQHPEDKERRLIPIVPAVGNHEVTRSPDGVNTAPLYRAFLLAPGAPLYQRRQFGQRVGMVLLDSGHVIPHRQQTDFLAASLSAYENLPYRLAIYHAGLFPSVRPYEGEAARRGREHWLPLFNTHRLTAAFEHHDHALKRARPRDPASKTTASTIPVFLGDGCFGRSARSPEPGRPYLEHASAVLHFWLVDAGERDIRFRAIGISGETLDDLRLPAANDTHP